MNDPSREASVTYKVEFLDHLTGSSISLFPIIGIGDLDFYQSVAVDNALRVLPGSGLSISKSASSILAKSNFSGDTKNDDPRSQAWFLLPNCSTFNYTFKGGRAAWQELGNLSMPGGNKPLPKTTSINFHYDTKSVKILMPEVLIYGHFRHYLHVL